MSNSGNSVLVYKIFFFNCGADSFKSPKCDRKMLKVTVIIRNVTAKC